MLCKQNYSRPVSKVNAHYLNLAQIVGNINITTAVQTFVVYFNLNLILNQLFSLQKKSIKGVHIYSRWISIMIKLQNFISCFVHSQFIVQPPIYLFLVSINFKSKKKITYSINVMVHEKMSSTKKEYD